MVSAPRRQRNFAGGTPALPDRCPASSDTIKYKHSCARSDALCRNEMPTRPTPSTYWAAQPTPIIRGADGCLDPKIFSQAMSGDAA